MKQPTKPKHILIIEPDSVLASQYVAVLSAAGHDVRTVDTAQAAILAADKQRPHLVILEPLLAAHSGIEFLYEFRSYAEWQQVPIIIMSRVRDEALGITAAVRKQCCVTAVLYKPEMSLSKLRQEVGRALT